MKVVFRADANHSIGMGHIMRCLSIADAFRDASANVSFVLADDTVRDLVSERGYDATILGSDYSDMEEELSLWQQEECDYLVVDSYYVTSYYLETLAERIHMFGGKLVYIDDVYTFPYPVDVLINYNAYGEFVDYDKLYSGCKKPEFYIGPQYAPLRGVFCGIEKKKQPLKVKNILISTGGSDELHLTLSFINYLIGAKIDYNNKRLYHFLIGSLNKDKEEIEELSCKDENIVIYEDVSDMKSLIQSADLVISAAGSTLYEICACGVPLITYSSADNQLPGAEAFEQNGLAVNVGDLRDTLSVDVEEIMSGKLVDGAIEMIMGVVDELNLDYDKRVDMGLKMQKLIDGCGAERLVCGLMD